MEEMKPVILTGIVCFLHAAVWTAAEEAARELGH